MQEKRFLIKDQSGRGFAVTLPMADVLSRWDGAYSNDPEDSNETSFGDWMQVAEVGDTYDNVDENVTFTRTE